MLMRLDHPNIVSFREAYLSSSECFIVTELIQGLRLSEHAQMVMDKHDHEKSARSVIWQILLALNHMSKFNVMHCDLKPNNIMVTRHGHVKVVDFGLAHDSRHPVANTIIGTQSYMAPEVHMGEVCPKSDLWSLGVIACELLTGIKQPFFYNLAIDPDSQP